MYKYSRYALLIFGDQKDHRRKTQLRKKKTQINKRPTFIWRPATKVPEKLFSSFYNKKKTSIQRLLLLSGRGQFLAFPRVILFCFVPLLNGQKDLKFDVFSHMKVKE